MSTTEKFATAPLPDYIAGNVPNPLANRAPWYKNTAPTYAGIFLWFVFWQDAVKSDTPGGGLAAGLGVALLGIVLSALICHFLFYYVPGMLGMQTGRPLYIVGTSTFGATGGFLMPGFLMGVLQFGWLGVNTYFSSLALSSLIPLPPQLIMVFWGIMAAFIGLAGIQYVAKVATYLPLIPLVILLLLFFKTVGGLGSFDPAKLIAAQETAGALKPPMGAGAVLAFMMTYIVGFFATAGAAGVDFGMNNRDKKDVQMGGYVGIALATIVTAGLTALIVAGAHGMTQYHEAAMASAAAATNTAPFSILNSKDLIQVVFGANAAKWMYLLLAISAFPSACFSSFIAANSFKTTLPKVNPYISVGIGAIISITLAVTGLAGQVVPVFVIIGASFGPICGAMAIDYMLAGNRWTGPRAGINPAGWIAWALGFIVGILPNLGVPVPAAPVAAFLVGAIVYYVCSALGMRTPVIIPPGGTGTTQV